MIKKIQIGFIVLSILTGIKINAATVNWNLKNLYGINQNGFIQVLNDARLHFLNFPNDTVIIDIDSGTYLIGGNGTYGINLSQGMAPGPTGRLIFQGAGVELTKLVFTEVAQDMIRGVDVFRTEFRDMHMARATYTVTQGNVVSVAPGEIVLDIHDGFPTPLEIYSNVDQGRYLRRYTTSLTDPQVILNDNEQVAWGWRSGAAQLPELISGNLWRFYLNNTSLVLNNYTIGEYVGVKSKHEGHTYWFLRGDDLTFNNIKWTGSSRGLVRGGFSNVKILNCSIERGDAINGQTPCLSTPSGGPQMNQYASTGNSLSENMVVENFYCDSTGDDCLAFFNVNGGKVINSIMRNSFARGILISQEAYDICVVGTTIENNPIALEDSPNTDNIRQSLSTYDLNEALTAGFIHNNCTTTLGLSTIKKNDEFEYKIVDNKMFLESGSIINKVSIYNYIGQTIVEINSNSKSVVQDISFIKSGIYFIKLSTTNGIKLVKLYFKN